MITKEALVEIADRVLALLDLHRVDECEREVPMDGAFGLYRGASEADLYAMIDAVYILYTLGRLEEMTTLASRRVWADRILACQDEEGWFSLKNLRGHPREHATAYAVGALRLLEVEPGEVHTDRIKPIRALYPLVTSHKTFHHWIERMGFHRLSDIPRKNVGWHHVWRGSHVGGGVAAVIGMLRKELDSWWPTEIDVDRWFHWYFEWLDREANPRTGYWQRAFWNTVIRRPTLIDLGGATHFYWIYEAAGRPYKYPGRIVESTLSLQKPTGLYKDHPFCIDLDANFSIIRPFLQLGANDRDPLIMRVSESVERNFDAVVDHLLARPLTEIYGDLHGPPGALVALVECSRLPGFSRAEAVTGWRHVLDRVWWL